MSIAERLPASKSGPAPMTLRRVALECLRTACLTLVVCLVIVTFIGRSYQVFGSCMDPNLVTGERLLGSKLAYVLHAPARGDIIVFTYPQDKTKTYVKRVIALPGEKVEITNGVVLIDGHALKEPYLRHAPHGDFPVCVVKPGCLFVMGDYRDCSNDSRYWGQLPISDIQAKAWLRYWPIPRAQLLH